MGLPVLRLPHIVFNNIYQSLDVSDKILLSQCSRRVRHLVRSQEGPRTCRQVAIRFDRDYTAVQVVRRTFDYSCRILFTLEVRPSVRNRESTDKRRFFHLDIDETTWDVKKCPPSMEGDWYCVPEKGAYEKDVLIIVKMLRNLFNCSILYIDYTLKYANFQKLFVETDALHRADQISIAGGVYDPKDMDFMFDHFVAKFLWFWANGGRRYSYQKPFNFPKFCLDHATWVNLEKVLEMTRICKIVRLTGAKLMSDKDINQFIKWWLTSDNKTLEYLTIARGTYSAPTLTGAQLIMNRSVIMEGIESTPGKKKRDEATKYLSYLKWEYGVDIIRKDGVQATIVLCQRESYEEFILGVWYHPNPNVDN